MKPRTTGRPAAIGVVLAAAVLAAGCLVKDSSSTICLEPNGSVRWTILERNIHATGDTPADRQREEEAFMAAARADQHRNAIAFRMLGATDVRTEIVSAQWPFAVLTEARFADIARVWQQILDRVGEVRAQSVLERNGDRTTWRIALDYDPDSQQPEPGDASAPETLLDDASPTIVMRHGQFVDGVGFEIIDDGRVAKLKNLDDHDWSEEPHVVLSLTWVATEAVNAQKK